MEEVILKYSKFASRNGNFGSYDIIQYHNRYYCGTNLYKYFRSYLAKEWALPVVIFDNDIDAYKHFNSIDF